MGQIAVKSAESRRQLAVYKRAPAFAPAGQSTQMIIGATPESDRHILDLTEALYKKYALKRVFFSAYLPVVEDERLPALSTRPPLLREHRLYQADWLLRYYHFSARELLSEAEPNFDPYLDPKCTWALRHPEFFPVEVNTAAREELLRVPGIGPKSALRIVQARRMQRLGMAELKRIGVVLKRAQYFITCGGRLPARGTRAEIAGALLDPKAFAVGVQQLSLDDFVPRPLPCAAPAVQELADHGVAARQAAPPRDKEVPEMFQPGEFVVYGSSGVCRVVQVGALEGRAADPNRKYYTLQPLFESERIYTPVDSGVFMRPAMTREQAQELIHEIPSIRAEICTERNPTTLRVHYEASLQSHECRRLISLIKGIRRKGEETEKRAAKWARWTSATAKRRRTSSTGSWPSPWA